MSAFDDGLELTVGKIEKGFSNHPHDRGGATMYGVTQNLYNRWRRLRKLRTQPVSLIEETEVRTIYRDEFWVPAHCDFLRDRLAKCVFDAAVHHGPEKAIELLQRALGIDADGKFGEKILSAASHCDESATIEKYLVERKAYMVSIIENDATQKDFENGWFNRLAIVRAALINDGGSNEQPASQA